MEVTEKGNCGRVKELTADERGSTQMERDKVDSKWLMVEVGIEREGRLSEKTMVTIEKYYYAE